ncbi:unnamed protein product [Caenorhabditis bovis]|uniref:G-protein coupled receptors family 1 profile domain-containing protein n=1 Tax=Caenorhabditis bovis TaxID=2654633 RepID=A0A8S1F5T9_9PELO|nr:unnamed protein product [Caenorhabditis bovis]
MPLAEIEGGAPREDVLLASLVIFMVAFSGLLFNIVGIIVVLKNPILRNSFGTMCLSHSIADSGVLLVFFAWAAPATYVQSMKIEGMLNKILGQINIMFWDVCVYSHLMISMNRLISILSPSNAGRIFSRTNTYLIIAFVWLVAIMHVVPYFWYDQCYVYYSPASWTWNFAETYCGFVISTYTDYYTSVGTFIIMSTVDFATLTLLVFHRKHTYFTTNEQSVKRRKVEIRFFVQSCLQGILFFYEIFNFYYVSTLNDNRWFVFFTSTFAWEICHSLDGLVVCLFHFRWKIFLHNSSVRQQLSPTKSVQNSTSLRDNDESTIRFKTIEHGSEFCVAFNVTQASSTFREDGLEPISLIMHATSHFMRDIETQCSTRNWNGPISVSLFIDQYSVDAVDYIHEVHRCSAKINSKLNVHVVYRKSPYQLECNPVTIKRSFRKCATFNATIRSRERSRIIPPFGIYPINVMRNVARIGAPSDIQMLADIEMVFSEGFALKMKKLANQYIDGKQKNLLVIRAFEFHHKYFPAGHTIESLWQWFRMSKNTTEPYAWEIDYKSSSWEAQFILHRNDPHNAEFMPTRIRDQQALVYELCRAGYKFLLVSHVFNVHKGVKTKETNLSSAVLTHQRRLRARAFRKFSTIMNATYPDTYKYCGKFIM